MDLRLSRQSGLAIPKAVVVAVQSIREFKGRVARCSNSDDGMSVTVQSSPVWVKISRAKPAQLVSGPPEKW